MVTAVTVSLAITVGLPTSTLLLLAGAVLAGQVSVGWSNDWIDAADDTEVGRADKPAATGAILATTLRLAALLALLVSAVLSLLLGVVPGILHLLGVGLAWTYNAWLKATPASVLAYLGAFALIPVVVTTAAGQGLPAWWAVLAAAMFGVGVHLSNVLPDIEQDRRHGIGGLPQRLGRDAAALGSVVMLGVGSVAVLLGPASDGDRVPSWAWAVLVVVAVLLAAVLLAAARGALEMAYRLTVVVGLLVVGSLVLQGGRIL